MPTLNEVGKRLAKSVVDSPKRLALLTPQAALTEYALALGTEVYDRNPKLEPTEVLFEVRDAVGRTTSQGLASTRLHDLLWSAKGSHRAALLKTKTSVAHCPVS
jgi:hypothetical protein